MIGGRKGVKLYLHCVTYHLFDFWRGAGTVHWFEKTAMCDICDKQHPAVAGSAK
jgi:uncharacterized protein (DUF924 family)